jgi:hypothetical protein
VGRFEAWFRSIENKLEFVLILRVFGDLEEARQEKIG